MQYHHTGVITSAKQPNAIYVEATKVWVTNPQDHPHRIEFLHFEPDTPVQPPVSDHCHTAYTVADLDAAIEGQNVVLGPLEALEGLRVAFIEQDGAVIEYMQFSGARTEIS